MKRTVRQVAATGLIAASVTLIPFAPHMAHAGGPYYNTCQYGSCTGMSPLSTAGSYGSTQSCSDQSGISDNNDVIRYYSDGSTQVIATIRLRYSYGCHAYFADGNVFENGDNMQAIVWRKYNFGDQNFQPGSYYSASAAAGPTSSPPNNPNYHFDTNMVGVISVNGGPTRCFTAGMNVYVAVDGSTQQKAMGDHCQ